MNDEKTYEYTGKIYQIGKTQTFPSGFMKRTCVLINDEGAKYPKKVAFDFCKFKNSATDLTMVLNRFLEGQEAKVKFDIESRENPNKPGQWFSQFRAIAIEKIGENAEINQPEQQAPEEEFGDDEMPF